MTIRRYDVAFGKEIEHEHGPWVRYRDAARLEEEIGTYLDRLQEAHEEIAVLREALRRSYDLLKKYNADEDEADANTVEVICHIVLDIVDMLNPGEQQDEYASIRKAAGVER